MKLHRQTLYIIAKSTLMQSIVLNALYLAFCLLWGNLRFEAIDDYFMAARLSGALGSDFNPHLIFVNAVYGYSLLPLYHIMPQINWYYIGELFAVFTSLSTLCYIILKRLNHYWGILGASVLILLLARDLYLGIQFTLCAAVLSAAGLSLFANTIINGKYKKKNAITLIFSIFLIVWGSIMRWQVFLMGLPLFIITFLICFWRYEFSRRRCIISFFIIMTLSLGLHAYDQSLYEAKEYKEFIAFQGPRVAIGDAVKYDKNAVLEDVDESGRDDDDFLMLTDWMFYDTEIFTPDSIRVYTQMIKHRWNYTKYAELPSLLLSWLNHSLSYPVFWLWFGCCVLIFAFNRSWSVYPWLSLSVILLQFCYLIQIGRFVYRVEIGFWLYAIALAIPLLKRPALSLSQRSFFVIFISLLLSGTLIFYSSGDMTRDPSSGHIRSTVSMDSTDYTRVFDYIEQNPDKIFFADMTSYKHFSRHRNPPYLAEPQGSFRRIISLGYWTPYLPEIKETLADFGVSNPIKNVINDNVIVINAGDLSDFLDRHYHIKATAKEIKSIGDVHFYSYHLD